MQEVRLKVRFTTPALGAARRKQPDGNVVFGMQRDGDGRPVFSPSLWSAALAEAAALRGVPPELAAAVSWDPVVEGTTATFRRYLDNSRGGYARHEAFLRGSDATVRCRLPVGLDVPALEALSEAMGRYRGVSPYKPTEYGRFQVVAVESLPVMSAGDTGK